MKKVLFGLLFSLFFYCLGFAGPVAYQTFTWQIMAINEIWVSGNPPTLIIDSAVAGQEPQEATNSSTTYTVVTNEGAFVTPEKPKKITGVINQAMPPHTYLKINLQAPAEGWSEGDVELSETSHTLVDYITVPDEDLTITYKFGATAEAGTLSGFRVVTLTLTDSI